MNQGVRSGGKQIPTIQCIAESHKGTASTQVTEVRERDLVAIAHFFSESLGFFGFGLVRSARVERATVRLEGGCSIQLSYERSRGGGLALRGPFAIAVLGRAVGDGARGGRS